MWRHLFSSPVALFYSLLARKNIPLVQFLLAPVTISIELPCNGIISQAYASNIRLSVMLCQFCLVLCVCFTLVLVKIILYLKWDISLFLIFQAVFYFVLMFSEKLNKQNIAYIDTDYSNLLQCIFRLWHFVIKNFKV